MIPILIRLVACSWSEESPLIHCNPRHHQPVITNREAMNPFMHESKAAVEFGSSFCPRAA